MQSIVVATDLSVRSDRAMYRAAMLAKQEAATLHVAHVVDEDLPASIADRNVESARAALLEQAANRVEFEGIDVRVHVQSGHPWRRIVELASELKGDLLVLGTHRNHGVRDLFSGTTVERIITVTPAPVLVVQARVSGDYRCPLVGVDFSECSRKAVEIAAKVAPGATLTLVNAYHIPFKAITEKSDRHGEVSKHTKMQYEAEQAKLMDEFLKRLTIAGEGRTFVHVYREGGPRVVLQAEAQSRKADLLAVGAHGRSWLAEAFLGSTTRDLLAAPMCDVLLAPL